MANDWKSGGHGDFLLGACVMEQVGFEAPQYVQCNPDSSWTLVTD